MEDCQCYMLRFCVIGYPIQHSLSPRIHNRAFRKLGILARYEAISVRPRDLGSFIRKFRKNFTGANVTIPHKERVIKFLDVLSPEARAIGAVNTIVNRGGKLIGYNTDVFGAMEALGKVKSQKSKVKSATQKLKVSFLKGEKVIVLGAGGAARAVIYGLKKAGAKVIILNRTLSRAKKLAKEFKCSAVIASPGSESGVNSAKQSILECDILINTTSVGMKVSETPFPKLRAVLKIVRKKPVIMDIVYTPRMTKLLRDAKRAGCNIITGDKMFLAQAAKSFELWTGTRPKFVKL